MFMHLVGRGKGSAPAPKAASKGMAAAPKAAAPPKAAATKAKDDDDDAADAVPDMLPMPVTVDAKKGKAAGAKDETEPLFSIGKHATAVGHKRAARATAAVGTTDTAGTLAQSPPAWPPLAPTQSPNHEKSHHAKQVPQSKQMQQQLAQQTMATAGLPTEAQCDALRKVVRNEDYKGAVELLANHGTRWPLFAWFTCSAILNAASDGKQNVDSVHVVECILGALNVFGGHDAEVATAGLGALTNVCSDNEAAKTQLCSNAARTVIAGVLRTWTANAGVMHMGCVCLVNIATSASYRNALAYRDTDVANSISSTLSSCPRKDVDFITYAASAVVALTRAPIVESPVAPWRTKLSTELCDVLGDESHVNMLCAEYVLGALLNLSFRIAEVKRHIVGLQVVDTVVVVMERFRANQEVCSYGLQLLEGLSQVSTEGADQFDVPRMRSLIAVACPWALKDVKVFAALFKLLGATNVMERMSAQERHPLVAQISPVLVWGLKAHTKSKRAVLAGVLFASMLSPATLLSLHLEREPDLITMLDGVLTDHAKNVQIVEPSTLFPR